MDRLQRTYAHSAWTPADPLAGMSSEVRLAILTMPSTFRERWKLAPWTDRHQRHHAMVDILAERRLAYELTHRTLERTVAASAAPAPVAPQEPTSPYYRYRLALHQDAMAALRGDRHALDQRDLETLPEARADRDRRDERRQFLHIELEQARLNVKTLELLTRPQEASEHWPPAQAPKRALQKSKRKDLSR